VLVCFKKFSVLIKCYKGCYFYFLFSGLIFSLFWPENVEESWQHFSYNQSKHWIPDAASLCHVARSGNDEHDHQNRFLGCAELGILDPAGRKRRLGKADIFSGLWTMEALGRKEMINSLTEIYPISDGG
jgi:hypothetical protein